MLPPDVRVARDAQDLIIECCVGMQCFRRISAHIENSPTFQSQKRSRMIRISVMRNLVFFCKWLLHVLSVWIYWTFLRLILFIVLKLLKFFAYIKKIYLHFEFIPMLMGKLLLLKVGFEIKSHYAAKCVIIGVHWYSLYNGFSTFCGASMLFTMIHIPAVFLFYTWLSLTAM